MTALIGFPLGTVYNITNISNDVPGVVTLESIADTNSFAVTNGQTITISKVVGMNQVNSQRYIIARFDANNKTFSLYNLRYEPVDTTNFIPYISGGEINIVSYDPAAGQPPGLMYNNQ